MLVEDHLAAEVYIKDDIHGKSTARIIHSPMYTHVNIHACICRGYADMCFRTTTYSKTVEYVLL